MVTEIDIANFIVKKISLSKDKAQPYRRQVDTLRERLSGYIDDNPEFDLIKMLHSGSVRKGTALSTISDMDVAVYIKPDNVEGHELNKVLEYIRKALVEVYKGLMKPDQFSIGTHCVKVDFKGSGLDVDVVPVIYRGKPDDRGDLLNQDTGEWLETSIPLHLDFIRARKELYPPYADMVRLTKWWKEQRNFKFKSFLVELIWAHLVDASSLPETGIGAFALFLAYILRTRLQEKIIFSDYYMATEVEDDDTEVVKIYDPVNPENNVGHSIEEHLDNILEETQLAFDSVANAVHADTKSRAIEQWRRVLGESFNP